MTRPEYRTTVLRELIDQHGVEWVAEATGLSIRTVLLYADRGARAIPIHRLERAERKTRRDD